MSFLPPGFRAMALVAGCSVALGCAQLAALAVRDEPYPLAAAALALLLLGGGATLAAFVRYNLRGRSLSGAPLSPADVLVTAATVVMAAEALHLFARTGTFFPLRMALFWRGPLALARLQEDPLPMMLAGTSLVALGAVATAALLGALWLLLYARGRKEAARAVGAALSFAGAIPYVATALVARALLCTPVALLAAGRTLALRPDEQLAYRSMLGMAPGLLAASVALGLCIARGLWSWLEQVRTAEERSDSFLAATLRGQEPWEILLRQGLWLRRRRELGALLLSGLAAAALIDVLSNTLIDSFRPPGFPLYPSLGAALFLRGLADDGAPAALPFSWTAAHVAMVLASVLVLLSQTFPRRRREAALRDGVLRLGSKVIARGAPGAHALAPPPSLQWVLGASGSGKSTLLQAWAADLPSAVLVPQDPDQALPGAFAATDLAALARRRRPRGDRLLWDLLGRLDDERMRRRFYDPFTPISAFSRGERQRFALCLALSRALADPSLALLLDEPTSAQDAARTHALLACVRQLLTAPLARGSLVVACHDPEPLDALLGDRALDHVVWLEDREAHAFSVQEQRWDGARAQPSGLQRWLASTRALLAARDREPPPSSSAPGDGVSVLRPRLSIGGRRHAISAEARVRGGELVVLYGPSGSGKSTLLREMATRRLASVALGFLMQDPPRAVPAEMPVREALGERLDLERLSHWFGPGLDEEMLGRSVGALSDGERQRLLLAGEVVRLEQSRASRLRLLLLDEPFGALDPAAHLRLMEALLGWLRASSRNAAVLVSHSPLVDLGLARASGVPACEWSMGGEA